MAKASVIADVTVRQVYENRGGRLIHAHDVFPASARAAVFALDLVATIALLIPNDA